ncbi:potassium channel family protein [Palaeococcus ferrophilus]|uniref:potassium channel family protein n=1 Tax=Palaeococcus ferrophilus TaxID=83868 RepID=UPI000A5F0E7D
MLIGVAVVFLALVVAALFSHFEGVDFYTAIYWAVITMSTIGYGDITPATPMGRAVAMFSAVVGISAFTALVSLIAEHFISASLRRMMGMHGVKYEDHYVIIGRGNSVITCLEELKSAMEKGEAEERPIVVVVPTDEEKRRLDGVDVEVLVGDPGVKETLKRAKVDRARYAVVALDNDSKAVFTTLLIKSLSRAKVFVEVMLPENAELLRQAGADRVILGRAIAGRLLASSVFEPEVVDIIEDITTSFGNYDVALIPAGEFEGESFGKAFEVLYSKGLYPLGYVGEKIVLMPPMDDTIPQGSKLVVIKRVGRKI